MYTVCSSVLVWSVLGQRVHLCACMSGWGAARLGCLVLGTRVHV